MELKFFKNKKYINKWNKVKDISSLVVFQKHFFKYA